MQPSHIIPEMVSVAVADSSCRGLSVGGDAPRHPAAVATPIIASSSRLVIGFAPWLLEYDRTGNTISRITVWAVYFTYWPGFASNLVLHPFAQK